MGQETNFRYFIKKSYQSQSEICYTKDYGDYEHRQRTDTSKIDTASLGACVCVRERKGKGETWEREEREGE